MKAEKKKRRPRTAGPLVARHEGVYSSRRHVDDNDNDCDDDDDDDEATTGWGGGGRSSSSLPHSHSDAEPTTKKYEVRRAETPNLAILC